MKEFDIKIKETLEKTVTVEAENQQAAEEMVRQAYFDGEHILDADNFSEVDFAVDAEREVQLEDQEKLNVLLVKPGMYPSRCKLIPDWLHCSRRLRVTSKPPIISRSRWRSSSMTRESSMAVS